MSARVSIVVPAYNNADYIEETMRSILSQTYDDLEVIVADHASRDATWELLQQFAIDERVTLLSTPAGGGARANWNRVTEAASGELIKLVCGDDILDPEIVARQVALFDAGVVLVASARNIVDADGSVIIGNRGIGHLAGRHSGRKAIRATVRAGTNIFGEPACVMMRRDALARVGNWAAGEEYLIDEATYVSVLAQGDFVGIDRALASFRINAGQWSVRLMKSQAQQAIAFHEKIRNEFPTLVLGGDVRLGNLRARVNAIGRRLVYIWLGRRMRKAI